MIIRVVARNYVRADQVDAFIALAKQLVVATNEEEGCIYYQLHQSISEPTELTFMEEWVDQAALDRHMATAHFQTIVPQLREMAAQPGGATLYKRL